MLPPLARTRYLLIRDATPEAILVSIASAAIPPEPVEEIEMGPKPALYMNMNMTMHMQANHPSPSSTGQDQEESVSPNFEDDQENFRSSTHNPHFEQENFRPSTHDLHFELENFRSSTHDPHFEDYVPPNQNDQDFDEKSFERRLDANTPSEELQFRKGSPRDPDRAVFHTLHIIQNVTGLIAHYPWLNSISLALCVLTAVGHMMPQ